MSLNGTLRKRKCAVCKLPFEPRSSFARVCSAPCSIEHAKTLTAKYERRRKTEGRKRLMTRSDWIKKAQISFNKFIRARDADMPCICCGKFSDDNDLITGSRWDAGHYRSTGSAPHLRYVEDNCHRQTVRCNRHGAGRAVDYRAGLIARIGLERVEALEADQAPRKYTISDLQAIEAAYKAKLKELQ